MSYRITVEQGLAAHFNQPSGPSRPGVDWMIRIEGPKAGVAIARTYLSSAAASEEEKTRLAHPAVVFLQKKIESGWDPAFPAGILELAES